MNKASTLAPRYPPLPSQENLQDQTSWHPVTDPVRNRNDGEDFHLLWTARRALRLLDKRSRLVAVSIEGCSTAEGSSQTSKTDWVVDTAEYYGHENFLLAERVEYVQLKHSTVRTEDEWTVASLAKTVGQFAILFRQRCTDFGPETAITKLSFSFVTNRPIHSEVMQALAAAQQDEGETDEETISTLARWKAKSGLNAAKFKCFLRLLRLQGREYNRAVQDDKLRGGLATLSPRSTDEGLRDRLVEFVRRKTLTNTAHDPVIRQAALLKCLGVAMPEDLFPAPPRFEEIPAPLPTQQEEQVAECVRRANAPVLVHATSGVGKSVLARRLPALMPPGSVAVVFDGFAGGDYRKPSQPRHLHEMGLVQIANELAENGLCEPLLPLEASPHQYLRAFRRRLEQAAITLRQRHADALVLVVLDAADNSEDAAVARNESPSFARNLVQETPPLGCRLVLMARTERRNRFPDRAPETIEIALEPFSQAETAAHLHRSFPEADAGSIVEFHRYTGGNPRVQSYLLAHASSLPELLRRLGPGGLSVDDQIEFEVEDALRRTREHFGEAAGIDALCGALAALPPRVPTRILAKATNVEVAAIDSFVADLGRPLLHLDGYVQFRDEPAETWFRRRFAGDEASFARVVKSLRSLADKDAYVAAAWPGLLFQAGLHDELFTDVLGAEPNIEDVLEQRAIVRERLRFGLKVAWKKGDRVTTARLLLRLGEAATTEEHQRDLLLKNDDLISALWSPEQVRETVFRKRAGGWYGVAHARYAAMLAPAPEHLAEARQSLRFAEEWLDEWAEFPSDEPNCDGPDEEDAAAFARAWLFLKGPEQCVDWIARWCPEVFRFRVAHRLAESLLDRGDNFQALALVESARYQDARIALGALLALTEAGQMPSAQSVAEVVTAWSEIQPPDSEGYDFSSNKVTEEQGVVALAEAMARLGLNHKAILAHIERYLPKIPNYARTESYYFSNGHRDSLLCAYALRAVLRGEKFDPLILLPDRLKRDGDPLPHNSEVGEFKRVYGLLAPWYQLRAESLLGLHNIAEVKHLARTLAISGNSHFMSWQWRQDGAYWANYVAGLWWDVLLITNAANMEEVDAIETWLKQTAKWVYASTWTKLAWQSARANLPDLALRFATSARTILAGDRDDASSEAEAWLSLARALLPICRDEAAACFEYGLALLETRLGDESRDWLDVLSGIADSSGQTGNPQPQLAYRLARVAESVHERYDHKFPWEDIAQSLAHLCLTSALAIASRWADRRKADLSNILASLLPGMVSQKQISVNQALSLHLLADNWNRAKLLDACLSRETDRNQQDFLLDLFVRELSLSAPNLPAAEKLREVADRHGLASPILDQLLSRPPDPETRREREDFARYQRDPQELLVLEGDFTRASDIDQAMESWRQNSRFHFRDDVVRQIAATVPANRKVQYLRAWLEVKSLSAVEILFALQDIAEIWGDSSMAVAQETPRLIRKLTEDRAEELLASGYSLGFLFGRRGREKNRQPLDFQINPFVEAAARGATHLAATTFFDLAQEATRRLDPGQACEVLDFGLARIETMLGESDGDGPWRPELAPPTNVHEAVAGLLWARLAAPEAEQRWRAAHAVRRLCLLGEQACVDALLARIESESGSAFVDHRLPFYWLHARLYLLIALARATKESPLLLQPHAEIFSRLALASIPHVLIRAFAAEAALALESALHGTYSEDTLKSLRTVNQSPFPPSSEKTDVSQHCRQNSKFYFEIDLEPYWFAPLGRIFGFAESEVTERVEHWVLDCWKELGRWQWEADPRSNIFHERETSYSNGSYPKTDRLSFYLAYHAMLCVAGEFLSSYPVLTNQWEPDPFAAWLRYHGLTRTDGEWLADRRDPWPIQRRPWQSEAQSDTWRWEISRADFESILDINDGLPDKLPIWGNLNFSEGSKVEEIHISSALVSESNAHALLHALQTASNPHDYYLPDERDDREIRQGAFLLTGWIRRPGSSEGLDRFDPFSGRLPYPPPLPGKAICRLFRLESDIDFREWQVSGENPTIAFTAELWGDRFETYKHRQPEHGSMLYVTSDFLRRVLSRLCRCLILEVQISRRVHGYRSDGEEIYSPPYFRLFLVDADGKIQSL